VFPWKIAAAEATACLIHSFLSLFHQHLGEEATNFWTNVSFTISSDALTSVFLSYSRTVACRVLIVSFGASRIFFVEHLRVFRNQARAGTVKPASPIIESKAK